MRIGFRGEITDEPEIRAGFIGCGSHAFRNLYPTLQFTPVKLVAVCDRELGKADAFAAKFGAASSYSDHRRMLERSDLDAVFICVGYDDKGRPQYPRLAVDCLEAGCHVWMEKPPAACCADVERVRRAAEAAGRNVLVGMKTMFFPANEKALELAASPEFGKAHLLSLQYPVHIPSEEEFKAFGDGRRSDPVTSFMDHVCHPVALMLFLFGMPEALYYERTPCAGGIAVFRYGNGRIATITCSRGMSLNGGTERTLIVSDAGRHVTVENNTRVTLHRCPRTSYGNQADFFMGTAEQASAEWAPEFSLGQLYNKALFLLGYYSEINEFARSILERRAPRKGGLEHAWQATRIFEAFASGPGRAIALQPEKSQEGAAT